MKLKHEKKSIIEVDYNDLDKFITEEFGKPNGIEDYYECACLEEWGNDEAHTFKIDGKMNDWDKKYIEDMVLDKTYKTFTLYRILNHLCSQGKIEAAEYIINVSW